MKKTALLLLVFAFSVVLRADLLDDVSRQLDLLEKEYWRSQYSSSGDYRTGVENRLRSMIANINRISNRLRQARLHRLVDLSTPAGTLIGYYGKVRPATIKRFSLTFSGTSMRDYTREYRAFLREKEDLAAEKESAAGSDRQKKKRTRSSARRAVPTLANVDIIEYERWLSQVVASNMDKFLGKRNNGSDSERDKMNNMVSVYLTAVKDIRLGLVKIRQKTKMEFK